MISANLTTWASSLITAVSGTPSRYNPAQGGPKEKRPGLIGNRFVAAIAVVLTGYVAALTLRAAFLAISPLSLASFTGCLIACTGLGGGQCGTLCLVDLAVRRVSTVSPRQRTHSCLRLGAGYPSESHAGDGFGMVCCGHSICQGGQHNGRVLCCRGDPPRWRSS